MPELPELEVVKQVLQRRIVGATIDGLEIIPPGGAIVLRDQTRLGWGDALIGASFVDITRRGKFLLLGLQRANHDPIYIVINPKLTGRLQLAVPNDKRLAKTHLILTLNNGIELRYLDRQVMGQVYLVNASQDVLDLKEMGPEPFDVSLNDFRAQLQKYRGEIKGILTRGEFIAGIGNAYADEILWAAKLHPYRKKTQLTPDEIERLYNAMQTTLLDAIEKVRVEIGERIHIESRDFLQVHMKTGEPCPRCGTAISLVGANQRITNFCRTCQPGGLIKGM